MDGIGQEKYLVKQKQIITYSDFFQSLCSFSLSLIFLAAPLCCLKPCLSLPVLSKPRYVPQPCPGVWDPPPPPQHPSNIYNPGQVNHGMQPSRKLHFAFEFLPAERCSH